MDQSSRPLISVVIPTVLREELIAAIASAKAQTVPTEILVVVDRSVNECSPSSDLRGSLNTVNQVLYTGGKKGAAFARNLGVSKASGSWIAYLDDDDEWLPTKLETQLAVAEDLRSDGWLPVVACRAFQRSAGSEELSAPVPKSVYSADRSVSEYLFLRRGPRAGRASIFLPTLLVDRELASLLPWDEDLSRHQDWDWLSRLPLVSRSRLVQLREPLAIVSVGSTGSISARSDWAASMDWASRLLTRADTRVYRDFVAAQVLRYALQARSRQGLITCLRAFRTFGMPSAPAFFFGLTGIMPRRLAERVLFLLGRKAGPS